jgi:hypothetical protein
MVNGRGVEEPKICIGATEFADSTQNPKKNYRNAKSATQNETFSKKICLVFTLNV